MTAWAVVKVPCWGGIPERSTGHSVPHAGQIPPQLPVPLVFQKLCIGLCYFLIIIFKATAGSSFPRGVMDSKTISANCVEDVEKGLLVSGFCGPEGLLGWLSGVSLHIVPPGKGTVPWARTRS